MITNLPNMTLNFVKSCSQVLRLPSRIHKLLSCGIV